MTTDITPADLQNLTPEQLQALAVQIQNEQAAAQAVDTLLADTTSPQTGAATAAAEPSVTSATTTVEPAASATTPVVASQNEAPINPIANAVLNGVNVATAAAQAAEPVVAVIDPPAGIAIEVAVAVVNALEAMAGYLGLVPDGVAKQGIQAQIATVKQLVGN